MALVLGRLSPLRWESLAASCEAVNVFTVLFSVPRDLLGREGEEDSKNAAVRMMFHFDVNVNVQLK